MISKDTNASAEERVERIVEAAEQAASELARDLLSEAQGAEETYRHNVARYYEHKDEHDRARAEIKHLRKEVEELPGRAYRAHLDQDPEDEESLKAAYRDAKSRLEALEQRLVELEEELNELSGPNRSTPEPGGISDDALISQAAPVKKAYYGGLEAVNELKRRVDAALKEAHKPLRQGVDTWAGLTQTAGENRKIDRGAQEFRRLLDEGKGRQWAEQEWHRRRGS